MSFLKALTNIKANLAFFGLCLNIVGTVIIIFCPPSIIVRTKDGKLPLTLVSDASINLRMGKIQHYGFYIGLGFLLIGFILQLMDAAK